MNIEVKYAVGGIEMQVYMSISDKFIFKETQTDKVDPSMSILQTALFILIDQYMNIVLV